MEKLAESTKSILAQLLEEHPNNLIRKQPNIYPQMPVTQIEHYIKLAARKGSNVVIQFNPFPFSDEYSEINGQIQLSPKSSQIILTPKNESTIHLVQPQFIRHLRLMK